MQSGVTVADPAATYLDVGVTIGRDTTLLPGCALTGATSVGAGCLIGPYSTLHNATVGDRARIRQSSVEGVAVPAGAVVGPFVHLSDEQRRAD
jgi:bifunctional UDP-N-acetylglucosamine pyrophosphorylase/glucosamine-1-phosphate N-acetyltransferase